MFRAHVLIITRSKLYYTGSGIITPIGGHLVHRLQPVHKMATYRCDDTRGCVMQFWPTDDEHMCSKHVEAWNKLIVKQKFCASSWSITEKSCTVFLYFLYEAAGTRLQGSGEDYIMRSLMIYTAHRIFFGWSIQDDWEGRGMYHVWGRGEVYTGFWWGNLREEFHIRGSVHRNSGLNKSNKMQEYADIYLLLNYCTCFGRPSRPSSGVHKTVVAACGTDHTIWGASFFNRDQMSSRSKKLAPQTVWSVPQAATTVLCTPDDGRDGRSKHVE